MTPVGALIFTDMKQDLSAEIGGEACAIRVL
jgi:hypothetical protein